MEGCQARHSLGSQGHWPLDETKDPGPGGQSVFSGGLAALVPQVRRPLGRKRSASSLTTVPAASAAPVVLNMNVQGAA